MIKETSRLFLIVAIIFLSGFWLGETKAGSADNVSGFAWSENIGWLSFNCNNPELPSPRCANNYGVNINPSTGIFSGYAWSENIGWISFNVADLGGCPPSGACQAKLDFGTKQVSGWAKVLSNNSWIRLRDTNYGVSWNNTTQEMEGWAWSDTDLGWISFNCKNQGVCGTSNYKVLAQLDVAPPTVSVIADPASVTTVWQNSDAVATISCSDVGSGCDEGSYKLKTYTPSASGSPCPTACNALNWTQDTFSSPKTISSHQCLCGTAKDLIGNSGFSSPVEFKIDKTLPESFISSPSPSATMGSSFPVKVIDEDTGGSGIDTNGCKYSTRYCANPPCPPNPWTPVKTDQPRTCKTNTPLITVSGSIPDCPVEGEKTCRVIVKSKDLAQNDSSPSNSLDEQTGWPKGIIDLSIDLTLPVVKKIYCGADYNIPCTSAEQRIPKTFKSLVSDNVQISNCYFYVRPVGRLLWDEIQNLSFTAPTCPPELAGNKCYIVSKEHYFDTSGNHEMYAKCWDGAGHTTSGDITIINVAENHYPVVTNPTYTFSPCTSPTTQSDCNVHFFVSATDSDNDSLTYAWIFDDGQASDEQNPVHPYSVAGNYAVSVTVSDNRGGIITKGLTLTVTNPTLSVDLTAYPLSGNAPLNDVDLKATVFGTMSGSIHYYFDCGEDSSGDYEHDFTTQDPPLYNENPYLAADLCDYPAAGNYIAKVFIEKGDGCQGRECTGAESCCQVRKLSIAAGSGVEPPPEIECSLASDCSNYYDGDCGYNGLCNCGLYEKPIWSCLSGNCQCACQYDSGCEAANPPPDPPEGEDCTRNNPLVALSPGFQSGLPGQELTYNVSVNNKHLGCLPALFSLAASCPTGWTCNLDSSNLTISSGRSVNTSLKVTSPPGVLKGNYPVSVAAVTTGSEYTGMDSALYEVANSPPSAAIFCDPVNCGFPAGQCTGYSPGCLTFINGATDPDGEDDIIRSEWNVLDWGTDPDLACSPPDVLCSYTPTISAGPYTVELKVTDKEGAFTIASKPFTILQDVIAEFKCSLKPTEGWQDCEGLRVSQGERVYFRDIGSSPSQTSLSEWAAITNWSWSFEGGNPDNSNIQNPSSIFQKIDTNSGWVTLTITDSALRSDTARHQLRVVIPLPEWQETPPF